jgi:hypothetical protein
VKQDSAGNQRRRGGLCGAAAAAALAGITVTAAACGGGAHSSAPSAQPGQLTAQKLDVFARCMRGHGQPDFSFTRAPANSSLSYIKLGQWTAQVSPGAQLNSALQACSHSLGLPTGPPPTLTAAQVRSLVRAAACMRAHGYPGYPDPDIQGGRLVPQSLPTSIDTSSPQFQAALQTCHPGNS